MALKINSLSGLNSKVTRCLWFSVYTCCVCVCGGLFFFFFFFFDKIVKNDGRVWPERMVKLNGHSMVDRERETSFMNL